MSMSLNIYGSHKPLIEPDGRVERGLRGIFRKDLADDNFLIARELKELYLKCKERDMVVMQLDILKTMAQYLYPKPNLNITLTPGEAQPIPAELECKSAAELKALLPQAMNE